MDDLDTQRKFLHEFANHLTISDGSLRRAKKLLVEESPDIEKVGASIDMAMKYLKKLNDEVRHLRQHIHDIQDKSK